MSPTLPQFLSKFVTVIRLLSTRGWLEFPGRSSPTRCRESTKRKMPKTLDLERTLRCKLAIMELQKDKLTIQEASRVTGLSPHTLRYYERIGLIHPIDREENTRRQYTADDVGWIDFLTKLRATGISIKDMQTYAELQRQGDETLPQRVEMLKALRDQVEERISELNEHLKLVYYKIEIYQQIVEEKELEQS